MSLRSARPAFLRTFVAVKIAPPPALRRLHSRLVELGNRFRPVALDNLHVTLKFLGDTTEEQVPAICAVLKRVIDEYSATSVILRGLGAFPNVRRPAVVWVGLAQAETLCHLAGEIDAGLLDLGFTPESRSFQPHLTLLRTKSRPPDSLFSLLSEESQSDFGMALIEEVEFLQSELTRSGSRYLTLATFALRPIVR